MDTDTQILYLGVLVGWLFTTLIISLVGVVIGVPEVKLVLMVFIGTGIVLVMVLIAELICFFQKFKIVRRD